MWDCAVWNFIECNGKVVVTDVSSSTMIKVLQYLYIGNVNEADVDIDLLYAADKYEIPKLQSFSESIILKRLNIETVFDIALAANDCGSKNFKDCVSRSLCKHWKKIKEDRRSQIFLSNAVILSEILNQMWLNKECSQMKYFMSLLLGIAKYTVHYHQNNFYISFNILRNTIWTILCVSKCSSISFS